MGHVSIHFLKLIDTPFIMNALRIISLLNLTTLVLLLSFSHLNSQNTCNSLSEFAADECANACIGCAINGFQGTTAGYSGADLFCGGALIENNSAWLAFVASSTTVSFEVSPSNCVNDNGIQVAILPNCTNEAIACNIGFAGGGSSPISLTATVVVGQTYYLLVDGYDGDECSFQITSAQGVVSPPALGVIGAVSGRAQVCPYATTAYSVPSVANALKYMWTAPPGCSINGTGNNQIIVDAPAGNTVTVTFGNAGGQVTAKAFSTCGATTATVSKNVTVAPLPPTYLPPLTIYTDELPFLWQNEELISTPPGGIFYTTRTSWLGCDSIITQSVSVKPRPSGRVYWDINGNGIYNVDYDIPAVGQKVTASLNPPTVTNNEGIYQFTSLVSSATITLPQLPNYAVSVNPTVHAYNNGNLPSYNFALTPQKGPAFGYVFLDKDLDGIFNGNDEILEGIVIKTTTGQQAVSNSNGSYFLDNVAYPEIISVVLPLGLDAVGATSYTFLPNNSDPYNFPLRDQSTYGQIKWDVDQNNTLSAGDPPAVGVTVKASNGTTKTTSDIGFYGFNGLVVGDSIWLDIPGISASPAYYIVNTQQQGGYDFLLTPTTQPNLSIDITNTTPFRPGFNTKIVITVANLSSVPAPAVGVGLKHPTFLSYFVAFPSTTTFLADSMYWYLGDMLPMSTRSISVTVLTNQFTPIGTAVAVKGKVNMPLGDSDPANNTYSLQKIVVGSYDPNDKNVDPVYITPAILANNPPPLEYVIRFQNTGTYEAETVEIIDSLSTSLQWQTLRLISSSHFCTWDISPEGVVKFHFPNIMLPDSTTNEPGSHGFVKFSIQPQTDLFEGDKIANFCDIYFDFNEPIRTNTTDMHVTYFLPGSPLPPGDNALSARPNPASFQVKFSWPIPTTTDGTITLYNSNGVAVASVSLPVPSTNAAINTAWLPEGMYLAVLRSGNLFYNKRVSVVRTRTIRKDE